MMAARVAGMSRQRASRLLVFNALVDVTDEHLQVQKLCQGLLALPTPIRLRSSNQTCSSE